MTDTKLSELSGSAYAQRRKDLLSHVNNLRGIGAQIDLDLPRITIIGNQSAGKSSVVEAISGINVPRDAGTCTRCPMECKLSSSSGPWSCQIFIREEFDENGKRKAQLTRVPFGRRITQKGKVEPALRRAQAAILNPKVPLQEVLRTELEDLKDLSSRYGKPLSFSRNVVEVELEGPELTDLSFIDLPGIIQNAEPELINLVEDLVVSHIKGNCLILVALPMTDDIENQKALTLARKEDPDGRRTIGVITKPDMLTAGSTKSRKLWLDIIEGRHHPLTHGYYCTRQPDDAERMASITTVQARENEKNFFENTPPWSTSGHQHRFGTPNLIAVLSELLVKMIDDTLPKLRSKTAQLLGKCNKELQILPKAIGMEPATFVLQLITALNGDVEQYVRGETQASILIHENRDAFKKFKHNIWRTVPKFAPTVDASHPADGSAPVTSGHTGEEHAAMLISEKRPVSLEQMKVHIERSITRELPDDVPFDAKLALIEAFQTTWKDSVKLCFQSIIVTVKKMLEFCIHRKFKRFDKLLCQIRLIVNELVRQHELSCMSFIDAMVELELTPFTQNYHYLESATEKWLAKYKDARSGKANLPWITEERSDEEERPVDERGAEISSSEPMSRSTSAGSDQPNPFLFGKLTRMPKPTTYGSAEEKKATPFSSPKRGLGQPAEPQPFWSKLGDDAPNAFGAKGASPTEFAKPMFTSNFSEDAEKYQKALAALADLGFTNLSKDDLGKLNPVDEYERELKMMASVRGYFQVSYKRIIDNVPSMIDLKFVKAISTELQPFLISKLGLGAPSGSARCESYLAEDAGIVARRAELTAQKDRLENVERELLSFGI